MDRHGYKNLQEEDVSPTKKASLVSSIFNLSNTIIGSGVLAMPFVCKISGVFLFGTLLVVAGVMSDYAIQVLFRAVEAHQLPTPSYPSLGRRSMGRPGELLARGAVTLQQLGACTAYVVIVGDVLTPIVHLFWASLPRAALQIGLVVVVAFPLCLLPTMDSLKYVSALSLTMIAAFVITVDALGLYVAIHPSEREDLLKEPVIGHMNLWPTGHSVLRSFPLLTFAYLCHQNSFPIYRELKDSSVERMTRVSHWSMGVCGCLYLTVGLAGYVMFLSKTDPDLLNNFLVKGTRFSTAMDIVRTGFGFSFLLSYPIMLWEARSNIDELVFGERPYSFQRKLLLNVIIISCTTTLGVLVSGLEVVLGLVGSTCSPTMVFILPALFYLKSNEDPWVSRKNLPALCLLIAGLIMVPLSLTVWAVKQFSKGSE